MALLQFNAATVQPSQAFEPLPAGWYNVTILKSEMKPTSKGDGSYLELVLVVSDGPHAKRQLFDRLNLNNKNEVAKRIAYETLSAICHATGVIQLQDSTQLHGIPMQAKVTSKPAEGKYEAGNEIGGYRAPQQAALPGFVQPASHAPAAAVPAWVAPPAAPAPVAPPVAPAQPAAAIPPWAKQ